MSNNIHVYLGDGAYATFEEWGEVLVTAGHHDSALATDAVSLDAATLATLVREARARGHTFGGDP